MYNTKVKRVRRLDQHAAWHASVTMASRHQLNCRAVGTSFFVAIHADFNLFPDIALAYDGDAVGILSYQY